MGILTNLLAIAFGGLFGSRLQKNSNIKSYSTLGIGIIIVSLVGFIENMYNVEGEKITSQNLLLVLLAFFCGSKLGDRLHLEENLSNLSKTKNTALNAFIDTALYFGVGGLQISGPIALAIHGDNSQLFIKSFMDIIFAVVFGAAYGKVVALSSLPVAAVQILIFIIARFSASFFTAEMTAQLCAYGYIILFFSGFNLVSDGRHKVNNINMLPGIFIVVLFNIVMNLVEKI